MIIGANFMESIDCYRPAERPVKKENTKFVPKVQPEKDWTVLFYIDGNNNLSGMANHSFSSLKKVGTNKNVNIVAQLAIEDNDVRRGLVQKKDSDELFPESENLGKVNMGDPNTLRDFIISSLKYNPAKNVALVLWDHGAGFKGSMTDDKNKSLIDNKELANALKEAEKITGKKIDLINFNACLMQQTEVAYEIKNNANYLVGSEELEAGLRIPIPGIYGTTPQHKVMQDLVDGIKQKGRVTPEELAKLYVFESKNQIASSMFSPTQSALDLSKIDNVKKSADELAKAMIDKIKADPKAMNIIRDNISDTQKYIAQDLYAEPYVDFRDVGDFAKNLIKEKKFEGTEIQKKAAELLKNVDDAVIAEQHSTVSSAGKVLAGSTGLSIYLPKDFGFDNKGNNPIDNVPAGGTHGYENSTFAKDTNWDEFLNLISKDNDLQGKIFGSSSKIVRKTAEVLRRATNIGGISQAWNILTGKDPKVSGTMLPLDFFPYVLPIPGIVAGPLNIISGAIKAVKGTSKVIEGVKGDFEGNDNLKVEINGGIEAIKGVGSIITTGALIAGASSIALPAAAAVLGVTAGKTLYDVGSALYNQRRISKMTVRQKLKEVDEDQKAA